MVVEVLPEPLGPATMHNVGFNSLLMLQPFQLYDELFQLLLPQIYGQALPLPLLSIGAHAPALQALLLRASHRLAPPWSSNGMNAVLPLT